ncbi:sensor histidine kinase [Agromyces sp. SYSU T00266]|uniref:sensor histidine kinase n=1 Tax=Agromyces zhanjiangensis TaxID=3158562 RepID=UPI0033949F45
MRTAPHRRAGRVARVAVAAVAVAAAVGAVPAAVTVWAETADLLLTGAELLVGVAYASIALVAPVDLEIRAAAATTAALWVAGTFVTGAATAHQAGLAWLLIAAAGGWHGTWAIAGLAAVGVALASGVLPTAMTATVFAGIAVWSAVPRGAGSHRRIALAATAASAMVALALAGAWAAQSRIGGLDPRTILAAYAGVLIAAALLISGAAISERRRIARLRETAASAGDATGLGGLEAVLRNTLRDDRLRLLVLPAGHDPLAAGTHRDAGTTRLATTEIADEAGTPIALIVHRPGSLGEPALSRAVADAVRLADDHDRLQAQLETQRRDIARTRADLLEAAQAGRLAVASRVDEEVLEPLRRGFRLLDELQPPGAPAPDAEATADPLAIAVEEVRLAERDLLGVVDAARARDLGDGRLATELRALTRSGVPEIDVDADQDATADAATETALYFIASEAVSNAMKHARASRIEVSLDRAGDAIRLEVVDDGRGGVRPTGIPAIRRRVEALAGRLEIESPVGEGTRVTAEVPRRRSASTARRSGAR